MEERKRIFFISLLIVISGRLYTMAQAKILSEDSLPEVNTDTTKSHIYPDTAINPVPFRIADTLNLQQPANIYDKPYSLNGKAYNWHQLWINTAALSSAFVGTLLVLECLPEDATSWNRAELRNVPLFKRWRNHVLEKGPEWDHDKFYFNYILHPYAGAVYYMSARSCGFNAWQSLLYCSLISNVGWEFGIEAFMERPSYQDMLVTPLVGSLIGEGFYKAKRAIADNGYRLLGSSALGNIVSFIIDPVNEVMCLFTSNPARNAAKRKSSKTQVTSSLMIPRQRHLRFGLAFNMAL